MARDIVKIGLQKVTTFWNKKHQTICSNHKHHSRADRVTVLGQLLTRLGEGPGM